RVRLLSNARRKILRLYPEFETALEPALKQQSSKPWPLPAGVRCLKQMAKRGPGQRIIPRPLSVT
ncbi:MAG TPA: hypothetical protein VFO93_11415, partial [Hymenobacter sp.]|uniref:hypothetical protein n=1 Tax=Hymenobacter sp. TaxID=1898978 RepID=UPI002D7F7DF0